jgi:hypothetical protein
MSGQLLAGKPVRRFCGLIGSRQSASHNTVILVVSTRGELQMLQAVGNGVADETIYGEWSGASQNQGREASDVQQVDLVTHRSELRARRRHGKKLY